VKTDLQNIFDNFNLRSSRELRLALWDWNFADMFVQEAYSASRVWTGGIEDRSAKREMAFKGRDLH